MVDYAVVMELRTILVVDHGGVEVG